MDEALEGDLGVRRDRQTGRGPPDHLHRLAQKSAGRVVLVLAVRDFQSGDHEQRRVHAAHHRHRARLAALVILLLDHVAVLALGAHHGGEFLVVRLHTIGAVVDPAGVGIAHDHHVAGADVIAAVVLVPARHRNLEKVDVVAGLDVLQERAARHLDRRDGLGLLHVFAPMANQLDLGAIGRIAHRHVDAADRGEQVRQDAVALGIAGDVVEQHQRIADLALEDIDDAADLALALGAADVRHLAGRLHLREPGAQILLRRIGFRRGAARINVTVHSVVPLIQGQALFARQRITKPLPRAARRSRPRRASCP